MTMNQLVNGCAVAGKMQINGVQCIYLLVGFCGKRLLCIGDCYEALRNVSQDWLTK